MNVNPMANVFSRTSCRASVYPGDWSSRSESKGAAMTETISRTPLVPSRKKNNVLARRWRALVLAVVPEPHEGAVHAPTKEQFDGRFDAREKREHSVVRLAQVSDVERKEEEVQGLDGDVAGAVDRQVLRELADLLKQRVSVSGT